VVFDYFILREGPGRLFDRVAMYASGSQVLVLARAQGSEWVLVQTEDFQSGWMNTAGLKTLGDFSPLPIYQYPGAVMLSGHVWNIDQSPAPRIGVRVQPLDNMDPNLMENVTTGLDGTWYAFLPANASGSWEVQAVSYGCPPEVPVGQCSIVGNLPDRMTITLPDALSVNLELSLRP
jgi:hypothetical protein